MAKDVDLSSKEWRDLVFEGKNQQYGAFELRKTSDARHNKAMIVVVIIIAIAFLVPFLVNTVLPKAEERPDDLT
jgi:protein TonB